MNLNESLQTLTNSFTDSIMSAIRTTPLDELLGDGARFNPPARGHSGHAPKAQRHAKTKAASKTNRLARRSPEQLEAAVGTVVKLLRKYKKTGLRAEEIRSTLGLDVREVPGVIRLAIANKQIKVMSGQKRSTTYGVGVSKKANMASKKAPKKAMKKAVKHAGKTRRAAPKKTKKALNGAAAPSVTASV